MERLTHKEKLTLQVSLALAAGMVSTMPVTYGAPILDKVVTDGATVDVGTTTKVASTQTNNVIDWKDFSVAQGEKIEFDGGAKTNNYLNIVTGDVQSHINGELKGGKDVYIVNPKGVIFGNGAQVDVGNLYVSTTQTDKVNTEAFKNNGSPLQNTAASATADVINMGQIAADKVSVEGGTIKFLDTAKVTTQAANVTLKANTAIRLGHDYSTVATTPGYTMTDASGTALTPSAFATITTAEQLQNLSANQKDTGLLSGDYELGADIDLQNGSLTPIGGNGNGAFSGTFDGNFFEVKNFTANGAGSGGLFGDVTGTIQHLGVVNATAKATLSGGIAGRLGTGGTISQSYVKNATIDRTGGSRLSDASNANGGIVGLLDGGTIEESYSQDIIADGGITGFVANGGKIYNVYNTQPNVQNPYDFYGIFCYHDSNSKNKVANAFTDATDAFFSTTIDDSVNLLTVKGGGDNPNPSMTKNASDYAKWTVDGTANGKAAVSKYGGEDTPWRIYDGQSLPLLRCFLTARGTKLVDYKYNFFHNSKQTNAGKLDADGLTTANPANVGLPQAQQKALSGHSVGEDLTLVYNGDNFKTVDSDNQPLNPYAGDSLIQSVGTDAVKNAGSYTLFYGGQDGYDLVGNYLTINKKTLDLTGTPVQLKRVYDGTPTLTIKDIGSAVGVVEGDDAHIDNLTATLGTTKGTVGHYTSEHKGQTDGITIANKGGTVKISGTDAANYELSMESVDKIKIEADIEKRSLYLKSSQNTSIDKYYDGTADTLNAPADIIKIDTDNQKQKEDKRGYVSGLVPNDTVSLDTTNMKTGYVDKDGTATSDATANTAKSARPARYVRYSNIALGNAGDAANYQLVDTDGNVFKDNSAYYDATGSIKQRVLNVNTFVVKDKDGNAAKAEKTYDGTSTYTVADGSVITAAEATDAGKEGDKGEGIISADYPNIVFSAKTGEFQDANGNATVDATDSGYTDAATQVGYHAQASVLNGKSESILGNYTLNDKILQTNTDYHVKGEGQIDRLNLAVGLLQKTGIDKTYNRNDDVDNQYESFGKAVGYTSDVHTVDTDTDLTWKITGKYKITDGDGGKAENVRIVDGKPAEKKIKFDVTLTGTHAQNYTLNGTDVKEDTPLQLGDAKGTITPVHLTNVQLASDANIYKTYDTTTTAGVADGDTDKLTLAKVSFDGLVQGDSKGDILTQTVLDTLNKNGNYYTADGKTADANVARDKDGKVTTKLVKYTGLTSGSNNYVFDTDTVAGQGTIKPLSIKDVSLAKTQAITKVYDGTSTVARDDYAPQGQQAQTAQNFVGALSTQMNGQTIKLDYTLQGWSNVFQVGLIDLGAHFHVVSHAGWGSDVVEF